MKAAGASRRVFQILDRVSSMPKAGDKCPMGLACFCFRCTLKLTYIKYARFNVTHHNPKAVFCLMVYIGEREPQKRPWPFSL